jgi:hypothetical protein
LKQNNNANMRGELQKTETVSRTKPLLIPQKKRPSNPLNKWIKETKHSYQITRKDVCYIYRNIIFTKTFGELKQILDCNGATEEETLKLQEERDKYPAIVIAIIAGVLGDIARGNILNLARMMQFVFPIKGFDPDEFTNKADQGGYDEIQELEDALRKLEGDDSILIVDKLLMAEGTHEFVNNAC